MKHVDTSTLSILLALAMGAVASAGCVTTTDTFTPGGVDVTLSGEWDVNGGIPTVNSCGDIDTVQVLLCDDASGAVCVDVGLSFACEVGFFDTRPSPVLSAGRYFTVWEALDTFGNVLESTTPQVLDVTSQAHAILAAPNFTGAQTATDVLAILRFEEDFGSNTFGTCSGIGIGSGQFEYSLHEGANSSAPTIVAETAQVCTASTNNVAFSETSTFQFDDGQYTLYVTAQETVGGCTTDWDGECTFTLTLGASNDVNCDIPVLQTVCF